MSKTKHYKEVSNMAPFRRCVGGNSTVLDSEINLLPTEQISVT